MTELALSIAALTVPAAAAYSVHKYVNGWLQLEKDRREAAEAQAKLREGELARVMEEFADIQDRVNALHAGLP